ncbi:hypothetical protein ACB092_04G037700 [Castanea dentata]
MRNLRKFSLPLSRSSSYLRRRPANDSQSPFLCPLVGLQAAKTLRITATKLCKLQIADGVIPYGWLFRIGFCKKILFLSNHS